jgi:hypothetical protein
MRSELIDCRSARITPSTHLLAKELMYIQRSASHPGGLCVIPITHKVAVFA